MKVPSPVFFKAIQRMNIVNSGYTIILNMGDQASDLFGSYSQPDFKLPNRFYVFP